MNRRRSFDRAIYITRNHISVDYVQYQFDGFRKILPAAIENALGIGYDAFAGQVLAYLEPEYQVHYRSRKIWDQLQDQVVRALEALQS